MNNARDIVNAVGRQAFCQALDIGEPSISTAVSKGKFPASWYSKVLELGEERGIEIPMSLFNWRCPVKEDHSATAA